MVEAWRQPEAVLNIDLESETVLALNTVFRVGEVVVRAFDGQRNGNGQRLAETRAAAVVLEGCVVRFIHGAAQVCGLVVSLNHGLIRIGVENW